MDDQASGLRREMKDRTLGIEPPEGEKRLFAEIDKDISEIETAVWSVVLAVAVATSLVWVCIAHAELPPPPADVPSDFFFKGRVSIGDWTPEFEADEQKKCEKMGGIFGRTINLELERVYWFCWRGITEPPALIPDPVLPRMNEPGTKLHGA